MNEAIAQAIYEHDLFVVVIAADRSASSTRGRSSPTPTASDESHDRFRLAVRPPHMAQYEDWASYAQTLADRPARNHPRQPRTRRLANKQPTTSTKPTAPRNGLAAGYRRGRPTSRRSHSAACTTGSSASSTDPA
jgi:hypothetical protein